MFVQWKKLYQNLCQSLSIVFIRYFLPEPISFLHKNIYTWKHYQYYKYNTALNEFEKDPLFTTTGATVVQSSQTPGLGFYFDGKYYYVPNSNYSGNSQAAFVTDRSPVNFTGTGAVSINSIVTYADLAPSISSDYFFIDGIVYKGSDPATRIPFATINTITGVLPIIKLIRKPPAQLTRSTPSSSESIFKR